MTKIDPRIARIRSRKLAERLHDRVLRYGTGILEEMPSDWLAKLMSYHCLVRRRTKQERILSLARYYDLDYPPRVRVAVGDIEATAKHLDIDPDLLDENISYLRKALQYDRKSINSGCCAYTPIGGRAWVASDGGRVIATLCELLIGWCETDALDCDWEYMLEQITMDTPKGQAEYEGGTI